MIEDDVVKEALSQLYQGPSPAAQADLDAAVQGGNLTRTYVGGTTSYSDPRSGLPLGAKYDANSPLGFTIADPGLRDMYSNYQGGLAGAVAQNRYDDAFQRDRLKNTLAIMKASEQMDPEIQGLIAERLGLRNPYAMPSGGGAAMGGIPTPYGNYMGARRTGPGPNDVEPVFAQQGMGGGAMGVPNSRTRQAMMLEAYRDQLRSGEKSQDRALKERQIANQESSTRSNEAYKDSQLEVRRQAVYAGEMQKLKFLQEMEMNYRNPGPGRNPEAANRLHMIIQSRIDRLNKLMDAMGTGEEATGELGLSDPRTGPSTLPPVSRPGMIPGTTIRPRGR